MPPRVAVIGAGAAGLSAARLLSRHGLAVQLFDKGHRLGGRLARRTTPVGSFQHGAPWSQALPTGLYEALESGGLDGVEARLSCTVQSLRASTQGWELVAGMSGPAIRFQAALVTVPWPQLAALLPELGLPAEVAPPIYAPCWTLLWSPGTALPEAAPPPKPTNLVRIRREDLLAADGSPPRITAHASADWSRSALEADPEWVRQALLEEAARQLGLDRHEGFSQVHRWHYAEVERPIGRDQLTLAPGLHYAGDACLGGGIAGAVQSGEAAATALLRSLRGSA